VSSFGEGFLVRHPVSPALVQTIRRVGEHKGREALYREQSPQVLEHLREAALIQSTEASNRLEGIVASPDRIRQLVRDRVEPRNRSEQEIAGYRDVLQTIHANHPFVPFTTGVVLQFHRDLFQFAGGQGGRWKNTDNTISEHHPDGRVVTRFTPVPAAATPEAMARLHARFEEEMSAGRIEPLLLVGAYVLDFLCIHPFTDGNGRMARLLTLLLLYRSGYEVGRYISLEQVVEEHRDGYYDTLWRGSQGWHEDAHDMVPWWEYLLGVVLAGAYAEFERRVGVVTDVRGAKRQMVIDVIERLPGEFRIGDVQRACPGVSRPTLNRVMAELRNAGRIRPLRAGRDALWAKS
jgi:Fic family protein